MSENVANSTKTIEDFSEWQPTSKLRIRQSTPADPMNIYQVLQQLFVREVYMVLAPSGEGYSLTYRLHNRNEYKWMDIPVEITDSDDYKVD